MAVASPYNPAAYVRGGATPAVAKATQALGYKYTPTVDPTTPPPSAPPSAPPTAPAAPPSSQAASYIPGEGIYAANSAAAYDAYNAAIAASDKDTQSARAQYGLSADGSNLDPSNSTGLFQRLMRTQAQQGATDHESAIAAGLGSTGLGAQMGEQHDFQNQGDLADLTNGYQGQLAAALARKGDANTTLQNALLSARQNQLSFDLQNQLFNMFSSGGDGGGDGSYDSTTPTPDTYYNPKTKKTTSTRPFKGTYAV